MKQRVAPLSMDNTFINRELELAATRMLIRISGSKDTLKSLYLQPDRALFLAENLHIILKVYLAEKALRHEYTIAQKAATFPLPSFTSPGRNPLVT